MSVVWMFVKIIAVFFKTVLNVINLKVTWAKIKVEFYILSKYFFFIQKVSGPL